MREAYLKIAVVMMLLATCSLQPATASPTHILTAQEEINQNTLDDGLYVVVGVFEVHDNATRYVKHINNKGYNTNYGQKSGNNYYYVYVYKTDSWDDAVQKTNEVRENTGLNDTWVLRVGEKTATFVDETVAENTESMQSNESAELVDAVKLEEVSAAEAERKSLEQLNATGTTNTSGPSFQLNNTIKRKELKGDYFVYLNAFNGKTDEKVMANVELIDNERAKLIKKLPSNELLGIWDPKNGTSSVKLICNAFGYQKIEHNIVLNNPLTDSTSTYLRVSGDTLSIDFKLKRLQKGDVAVMYNVYFFNDAAVMRPESKFEVNALLDFLKEKEDMKILLHGHSNGKGAGKIIRLDKGQKNYFKMSKENPISFGSAKELSLERAVIIKKYLEEQGITESRMEVKGWGGKKSLYDKDSPQAKKNIRVEVEILKGE